MIYTKQIREAVGRIPIPRNFVMDILEFGDEKSGFLLLRFYSSQWDAFSISERADAAEYMLRVQRLLKSFGINATMDPVIGEPNAHLRN